jgi:hypothetical protein
MTTADGSDAQTAKLLIVDRDGRIKHRSSIAMAA